MSAEINKNELFTPKIRAEIDHEIAKYPTDRQQSAVMAALRIIQDNNAGSLTQERMDEVAAYLDMAPIAVYEVATFYSMYEHKPVGRNKLCVCTNISCMINGSDKIVEHLNNKLGIKWGEVTEDGRYSLKEVECLGACGGAPMMQVDRKYFEDLTPDNLDKILDGLE
ncbi:NADH-ubiquinone oxidoreductase chain E [hydrothermal vent metagenome]|uniref:NADH-ubiquinone oxidoreductase chain E n=1 Tax=hydrothermal vent metagenome TaxID=652676 RepID=A0A3B1BHH6_9ZZZZ